MTLQTLKSLPLNLNLIHASRRSIQSLTEFRDASHLVGHHIDYGKLAVNAVLLSSQEELFAALSNESSPKGACEILRALHCHVRPLLWLEGNEPALETAEELIADFMSAQDFREAAVRLERRASRFQAVLIIALIIFITLAYNLSF